MCFGLYYLLLLCNASRNTTIAIASNNATKNLTATATIRPPVREGGDKHKREVDLAAILQDVQTRLPHGIPLPPIFTSPAGNNKRNPSSVQGGDSENVKHVREKSGKAGAREIPGVSVVCRPQLNSTDESQSLKSFRRRKQRLKEELVDSDEEDDDDNVSFSEPPLVKIRRRPVIMPRSIYEGGYYCRRYPRRRLPYSRIRFVPYYDSEELPDSEELDDDLCIPSPPPLPPRVKRRRQQRLLMRNDPKEETRNLRERLKEVLKQILNEANRQTQPIGLATGCRKKTC